MNIFASTYHVNIEISNLCNYSIIHKNCPASKRTSKIIMPSKMVYSILDTLAKYEYGGNKSVAFYLYNDSLNDPRLFKFIEYAHNILPETNIIIGTNGWYLNEVMAKELYEAGATFILVTAYSEQENKRLLEVKKNVTNTIDERYINNVSFSIRKSYKLDSRLNMNGKNGSCYAPLTELLICPDGKLRLCCLDIDEKEAFGDLHKQSFEEIITNNYERLSKLRESLINSERTLELCQKCNFINRMKGFYTNKGDFRNNASKLKRKK